MIIDWRKLRWVVSECIVGVALIFNSGCGNIFIRTPTDSQTQINTPFTLQAQKNDNYCSYKSGSFRAYLDKGQASQVDITSAFTRSLNSNIWTATDYPLPVGTHTFNVEGRFNGLLCWGKFDADSQTFEVLAPSLPDFTVKAFNINPTSPCTSDPTTATIVISNQGGVSASATTVDVKRNGTLIGTVNVQPLNNGADVTLSQNLTFPAAATYTIVAVVNPNNLITEASYANNSATTDITVRDCRALEEYYQEWRNSLENSYTSGDPMHASSDPSDYTNHPAFEAIVAQGNGALPFVMRKIEEGDFHMNIAASRITGVNPWVGVVVDKNWGVHGNLIGAQQTAERWCLWWAENKNKPQWQP